MQKRILKVLFFVILVFVFFPFFSGREAYAASSTVIRVGFPAIEGFSESNPDGSHSGYAFDFLHEISKYTGWEYEFVSREEADFDELLTMLENGEIDVMGGIVKNQDTKARFDFPEYDCGVTYTTLSVLRDNSSYSDNDYQSYHGMRVGAANADQDRIEKLEQFCRNNGISVQIVRYQTEDIRDAALYHHEVDAILCGDMVDAADTRILTRLGGEPYYFAVTKGRTDVLNGLNMSIAKMNEIYPDYDSSLYEKHFSTVKKEPFVLTEKEKAFISTLKPLTVVSGRNSIPVDYFDASGVYSGITADVFQRISEETGITFEYVHAANQQEALQMLADGKADIITGLFDDSHFEHPGSIAMCTAYLDIPMVLVKKNDVGMLDMDIGNAVMAFPRGHTLLPNLRADNMLLCDTPEECIRAVRNGEARYCYSNAYSAEYYKRNGGLDDLALITLPNSERAICFGIARPVDTMLLGVINRALYHLADAQMREIVFNNTAAIQYDVTLRSFLRANPLSAAAVVFVFCSLVMGGVILLLQKRRLMEKKVANRYQLLSSVLDEIIFEYDFIKDQMMISGEKAEELHLNSTIKNYARRMRNGELEYGNFGICRSDIEKIPSGVIQTLDFQFTAPNGRQDWYRSVYLLERGRAGRLEHAVGRLININEERRERALLIDMARRDTLTGLLNNGAMKCSCEEYLAENGKNLAHILLIIDVDNFKQVNDTHGHLYGDSVLKKVSDILRNSFRSNDLIGRIGGDEFAILARDIQSKEQISKKCGEILEKLRKADLLEPISCSIGASFFPKDGLSYSELFKKADIALYTIKRSEKNAYRFFENEMTMDSLTPRSTTVIDSETEGETEPLETT